MDLVALRQRLHSQARSVTIGETEWRVGKLSASETMALLDMATPEADEDKNSGTRFYTQLLSKTVLNGNGRMFDSDEGRAQLMDLLTWDELQQLGQAAMEFNGLGNDAKKN